MNLNRRDFIKSSFTLSLLPSLHGVPNAPKTRSSFDPWIEVNPDHLRHNVGEISRLIGDRPILAVIKNNGYGLGLANVARILEPLPPIEGFAVVKLQEAFNLRDDGIRKPVLLMGPFEEKELEEAVRHDITPMVYTPIADTLQKISEKLQKPVPVHVCVDTGIGRVGVPYREAQPLIEDLLARKGVRIEGTMMTFAEDKEFDREQLGRFLALCSVLERKGSALGKKHAVSSFGLFQHPDAFLDMIRPGMAIYGIYPEQEFRTTNLLVLKPAVSLKTRVIYVKQLAQGESAGYSRAFKPEKETWVATLPVGHADGLPRSVINGARVRIGNGFYRIVAISASHIVVEIGVEPSVRVGDSATVFDWTEGSRPEDFAASCGGSVYDLTMHLNPLLPRKIL